MVEMRHHRVNIYVVVYVLTPTRHSSLTRYLTKFNLMTIMMIPRRMDEVVIVVVRGVNDTKNAVDLVGL